MVSGTAIAAVDPTAVGPYKVAHQTIPNVVLCGQTTNISVWYPTNSTSGIPANYTTSYYPGVFYRLPSPLNALEDAPIASGTFPMVVLTHGSGAINRDNGRFAEMPIGEFLATHGFISVGFTYGATTKGTVLEGAALINYMTGTVLPGETLSCMTMPGTSSFSASIDGNKVGILTLSLGGRLMALASGNPDVPPDPRIKAIVGYEQFYNESNNPNGPGIYYANLKNVQASALFMHSGDSTQSPGTLTIGPFNLTAAKPLIDVYAKRMVHNSYSTHVCLTTKVNRDQAILDGITEPLINPMGDNYAQYAYNIWHAGENPAGISNGGYGGFGGASDFCDVSGWSPVVDPSLLTSRNKVTQEADVMQRLRLYTLSFFKTYLAGQTGFESFLTEQYAKDHYDASDLTVQVRN